MPSTQSETPGRLHVKLGVFCLFNFNVVFDFNQLIHMPVKFTIRPSVNFHSVKKKWGKMSFPITVLLFWVLFFLVTSKLCELFLLIFISIFLNIIIIYVSLLIFFHLNLLISYYDRLGFRSLTQIHTCPPPSPYSVFALLWRWRK